MKAPFLSKDRCCYCPKMLLPSLLLAIAVTSSCLVGAQISIPAKYDGFAYPAVPASGGLDEAVLVEAFFDPVCPDSRDSWPALKKAVDYYGSRVALRVHSFSLPYHSNSFIACRALHIANKLNASATYPLLELFFKYQEKYYNTPTYNMTRLWIIEDMSKLATLAVGEPFSSSFRLGFNDSRTDSATRTSFKYGCSRGVYGTPFFFVNGFSLPDGGSALPYDKWRSIIDPLVMKPEK